MNNKLSKEFLYFLILPNKKFIFKEAMMKEFIISYIEENEVGVHKKDILVMGENFQSCY